MSSIPNYVMQGVALPSHLCEKLDKISRDFLWGTTKKKKEDAFGGLEQNHQAKGGRWVRHPSN